MMAAATVTPFRPKDPTAAARARRYRQRRRDAVTAVELPDSIAVVTVASRVGNGTATAAELADAERWLLLLTGFLPAAT